MYDGISTFVGFFKNITRKNKQQNYTSEKPKQKQTKKKTNKFVFVLFCFGLFLFFVCFFFVCFFFACFILLFAFSSVFFFSVIYGEFTEFMTRATGTVAILGLAHVYAPEWQQVSSGLKDSSKYPTWIYQCFGLEFLWSLVIIIIIIIIIIIYSLEFFTSL